MGKEFPMRVLSRIGLSMVLVLAGFSAARAQKPDTLAEQEAKAKAGQKAAKAKSHQSLFSKGRLCAECQRRKVMMENGVNVPPAPSLPPGVVPKRTECSICGNPTLVMGGPMRKKMATDEAPGRAVVGGEAPGYASTGVGPAPIGVATERMAMVNGQPALRDPAVATTSIPPARDPIAPPAADRPHILSHLLGVTAIGRERAERLARKKEAQHASISYGAAADPVTDVPASLVYGRSGR
jgi:hypothetical protein